MQDNEMPNVFEMWLQMALTVVLLAAFSKLFMTPGFLSLRPAAAHSLPTNHAESR